MKKKLEELEKQAILRIIEEMNGSSITSARMLGILNEVRRESKFEPKKNCPVNKQKLLGLVRNALGEYLCEKVEYSGSFAAGRLLSKYYIENYEEAKKSAALYFEKLATKPAGDRRKQQAIGKILSIVQKISESPDFTIKLDLLKELIDSKTPVNSTMRNWDSMLRKEGIILKFKAERGIYRFDSFNVEEVKRKLEVLYGEASEEPKKTVPKKADPIPVKEERELTPDEEKVIFLLAKFTNRKPTSMKNLWEKVKKEGISAGYDFTNLIRQAGLKKWFVQTRNPIAGGFEYKFEFTGDIQAVASLMGQETEKTYLIRSSLDEAQIKAFMGTNYTLLNAKPGDNLYEVRCSGIESKANLVLLAMGFRGYDSFIKEDDAEEIRKLQVKMIEAFINNEKDE